MLCLPPCEIDQRYAGDASSYTPVSHYGSAYPFVFRFTFAQRARCAAAIFALPSSLILCFVRFAVAGFGTIDSTACLDSLGRPTPRLTEVPERNVLAIWSL